MCVDYEWEDGTEPQSYRWQRARKEHECCACERKIERGRLYHYTASLCDGHWATYHHCARCWAIVEHLWSVTDSAIEIRLDCGNKYEAPDEDPGHALAFMTDAEAEAWALAQPKRSEYPGGTWCDS